MWCVESGRDGWGSAVDDDIRGEEEWRRVERGVRIHLHVQVHPMLPCVWKDFFVSECVCHIVHRHTVRIEVTGGYGQRKKMSNLNWDQMATHT